MNIAFLFLHPFAGSLGSTVRVMELTSHLSKYGVSSYILTPYEVDQTLSERVNVISIAGTLSKVGLATHFYKLTKFAYYNPFFVKNFFTNIKLQTKIAKNNVSAIIRALKKNQIHILQVEQDFAIPTAIEVKKKTSLPLIVDLHNITSEELIASGTIRKDSVEFNRIQENLRSNLAEVDAILVVSNLMKEYVINNYAVSPNRVHVVAPGGNQVKLVKNYSPQKRVVFSGLVSYREHVDLFVKSMPKIQEKTKNVHFYITDKGENLKMIKSLAKKLHVEPNFFWYAEKKDFLKFLSSCDVAVLPSSSDLARQMGTPAKLFDYLSVGLPIVANNIGAWTKIIQEEQVGVLTKDNPDSFALGVLKLIESTSLDIYRQRCISLVENKYNWNNSVKILFHIYSQFIGSKT